MLAVDYVSIWELDGNHQTVSLKASTGRKEGSTDNTRKPLEPNSLEDFTLTSQNPVLIENLNEETRFHVSNPILEHGAVSGISVRLGAIEKPLGVIEIFTLQPQIFSLEDGTFLQSAGNILGLVMRQKRLEAELSAENRRLRQQLAEVQSVPQSGRFEWDSYEIKNRLSESREKERLRLAQELHDVPIQDLYGLIYQMDDLKDVLRDPDGERILEEHGKILNRIVNSLRTICGELRPPSLSPFGLEVAIRDHVEKLRDQNSDIQIHLDLMRDQQILSDSLRLNLFRIYQQAISNVIRHAEATDVYIRFRWDDDLIILEVEDSGKGFEVPKSWVELVREDHFGLVGLAERVESIRGKLEIVSALGEGTLVRAIVPRHK
jgi:signal transduction histidine kinase